ncbi:hypothetical protein [Streptomyces variegatus]|jgi:hypothetical protein|uniref:hypothetical protein n=1 Tax=Streptomyces variegatus TaxID=284040 RepID=UPI003C2F6CE3
MTADTAWHSRACILCDTHCGIQIQTDGRRFAKIRGDKEHVATAATPVTRPCAWTTTKTAAPG